MNNKAEFIGFGIFFIAVVVLMIAGFFFATGWDTGVMTGKIIGYDTAMFGTKKVFVLEERTVFSQESGYSQSQIVLCSDYDDTEIHQAVEDNINRRVVIEYKERRVGFYSPKYCHEAPITKITAQ